MIEITKEELLSRYAAGERNFSTIQFKPDAEHGFLKVDLSSADLRGINFSGSNLTFINLEKANLGGAILSGATLAYSDLREANLEDVIAVGAMLGRGCRLSLASLRHAQLTGANFLGGGCRCADFTRANMYGVTMAEYIVDGCDFSYADFEFATIIKVDFSKVDGGSSCTFQQAFFWQVTRPDGVYIEGPLFNP